MADANTLTDQLQAIIRDVAATGALTPDAIRQFDDYRKKAELLETSLENRDAQLKLSKDACAQLTSKLSEMTGALNAATTRAAAAETKIAEAEKAIWIAGFEKNRGNELRAIIGEVFRNFEVNRSITTNVAHPGQPQYPGAAPPMSFSTDTTNETEKRT
jgi:chromosome segregation ATPase